MLFYFLLALIANFSLISAQAIPYSYASGRDVKAVEDRYNRFQAAKARNASPDELIGICGKVDTSKQQCNTKVGRPKDSESLACDSLCCLSGQKVGNCGSDYGSLLSFSTIESILKGATVGGVGGGAIGAIGQVNDKVTANCYCSSDAADVRCGRDGSFAGIRCPFDRSACWRKCCREGKSGGRCKGFLNTKCRCD